MQKSTVRRGAIVGSVAGVAVVAALLAPAAANAAEPDSVVAEVTEAGSEVARPGEGFPAEPGEGVLVTKDRDGNVTVQRGYPGQLPVDAVPAMPIQPGTILVSPPGDHGTTRAYPGDPSQTRVFPDNDGTIRVHPGDVRPALPARPAPSTGSAG